MEGSGNARYGARLALWLLVAVMAASAAVSTACSNGAGDEGGDTRVRDEQLEVSFDGRLVYVSGVDLSVIDGQTGETDGLGKLEGELGWSGFIQLAGPDSVVYESLVSEVPGVRLAPQNGTDGVLLDEVDAIHDFADNTLLVSSGADLHIVDVTAQPSTLRPLEVGPCLSALLSSGGTEVAYVKGIPSDEPETTGELEQRLLVRAIDGDGDAPEVTRGWYAIEPLLLDADSLLIASYAFGGVETADLVLIDRRSSESTTVASDVTILDSDRASRSVAIASPAAADGSAEGALSIISVGDEGSAVTIRFEGVAVEALTAASLRPDGTGLIAAFSHEDGATTLVAFDQSDGSQSTVAEWAATRCTEVLVHPDGRTVFLVLEVDGVATPMEAERSIVVCDLVDRTTAELVPFSAGELVRLVGVR